MRPQRPQRLVWARRCSPRDPLTVCTTKAADRPGLAAFLTRFPFLFLRNWICFLFCNTIKVTDSREWFVPFYFIFSSFWIVCWYISILHLVPLFIIYKMWSPDGYMHSFQLFLFIFFLSHLHVYLYIHLLKIIYTHIHSQAHRNFCTSFRPVNERREYCSVDFPCRSSCFLLPFSHGSPWWRTASAPGMNVNSTLCHS